MRLRTWLVIVFALLALQYGRVECVKSANAYVCQIGFSARNAWDKPQEEDFTGDDDTKITDVRGAQGSRVDGPGTMERGAKPVLGGSSGTGPAPGDVLQWP